MHEITLIFDVFHHALYYLLLVLKLQFFELMQCLPACRRILLPLLQAENGRLRNAVANCVPASS